MNLVLAESTTEEGTTLSYLGQPVSYLPCAELEETSQNVINAACRCMSAKSKADYDVNYNPDHCSVPQGRTIQQLWLKQKKIGICILLVTARGPSLCMELIRHEDANDEPFTVVMETTKSIPHRTRANWRPLLLRPSLLTETNATPRAPKGKKRWSGAGGEPCVFAFSLVDAIKVAHVLGVVGQPLLMNEERLQPGWSV